MTRPTLVIMGSAGSGKGTQAGLLKEQLGYHIVEAGRILRNIMKEDTPLGKKVEAIINAGEHLTDEDVSEIMRDYIMSIAKEDALLIDGYPRTVGQKEMLEDILNKAGRDADSILAIYIEVDRAEVERRLLNRAQCTVCKTVFMNRETTTCPHCGGEVKPREYDKPEAIKHRLDFFQENILPVIKVFKKENKLLKINGMQEVAHVFKEIQDKLKPHLKEE